MSDGINLATSFRFPEPLMNYDDRWGFNSVRETDAHSRMITALPGHEMLKGQEVEAGFHARHEGDRSSFSTEFHARHEGDRHSEAPQFHDRHEDDRPSDTFVVKTPV